MSLIISFSGFQGSGKDTLANHLVKKHGFKRLAFADAMKDICAKKYDVPRHLFDDPSLKDKIIPKHNLTPREMCLQVGPEERAKNPLIFINTVINQIKDTDKIIITDARKLEEIKELRRKFGQRYFAFYIRRFTKSVSDHPIEYEIQSRNCDIVLYNSRDLASALEELDYVLECEIKN